MSFNAASGAGVSHRGDWLWHNLLGAVQVIERLDRWGVQTLRVWSPASGKVLQVENAAVEPIAAHAPTLEAIVHRAAAARVQEALTTEVLLAPVASNVTPLPHQLYALERAMEKGRVRLLFADEVGLGKTIEAGLVIRELKLRGWAKRILVVAPKGLTPQWQAEMRLHFGETFRIADPGDFDAVSRWSDEDNVWRAADQVICPLDSVKPLARRRGWPGERVAAYNQRRFEDLITADWDLVVIDEAHRLCGSTDQVARYKLGAALADATPNLLLLSATPHSGKSDQFLRLMQLLDREAFPGEDCIDRDRVASYVVRTEKRLAIDNDGNTLFKTRQTRLVTVDWEPKHDAQRQLYDAVTNYVRHGYNQALKSKQRHIGFLMVLMQRLVTSSTAAIAATLGRRLLALEETPTQLSTMPDFDAADIADMDGQWQLDELVDWPGWRSERAEVATLLHLAEQALAGTDAKVEALLEQVYRIQQEEDDPDLKVLIFTEFIPTQAMLATQLRERGFEVATLNGQMAVEERVTAQNAFAGTARVLISTDAGGEGLNLQFAHVVFNYDMPWNPMRIEQRIGRVDRIGQKHVVRATNFVLGETVEHRVREVLEAKLEAIAKEFGVHKAADVMDSVEAEAMFDGLYINGILAPDEVERRADATLEELRIRITADRERRELLGSYAPLDPSAVQRLRRHPIHFWVEKAVTAGLPAVGGAASREGETWTIRWPDGSSTNRACFDAPGLEAEPNANWLTLENESVRALIDDLPAEPPGRPVLRISLPQLPAGVEGVWSLWRIRMSTIRGDHQRYMPLFVQNGRPFAPTARRLWDMIVTDELRIDADSTPGVVADSERLAEAQAEPIYLELRDRYLQGLDQERHRMAAAFDARQRATKRIGLENVRRARSQRLDAEQQSRVRELEAAAMTMSNLELIVIVEVRSR
ncbi:DEAD/DEAH box helicase family protein [Rhizobium leguminosarum]|uniref:DEAD/DEAH box helicase n=1 Tax=Rhizobium leguminosarum TaxID=384 RepID=UPI001C97B68D|nr:helicase-related protein [Rhizobium leguminosarum]MBY5903937.1 DEAD/DEAH box helicase family protein [Rhizobium leguminosarum]MBY5910966.1 DEAD/DEAH box helicase family protein [Rhizobium leguminosarum]